LRITRVKRGDESVGVKFGKGESGNHMQVVLLPFEEQEELQDGTEGGK